jgi:hypothetical protein
VSSITADSALVTWSTNEPATSEIQFGLSPDALSSVVGDADLVTDHSLLLTGLTSATEHFFFVTSVDAAGQSAQSGLGTFVTLASGGPEDDDGDGDGVPDDLDRCPDTPADDHVDHAGCSRKCAPEVHRKHHGARSHHDRGRRHASRRGKQRPPH